MSEQSVNRRTGNRGVGIMFFSVFGTWWLCIGCRGLFGNDLINLVPALLLGAALLLAGRRVAKRTADRRIAGGRDPQAARRWRTFRMVNAAQWGAIVALIVILNVAQRTDWIAPGIMLIVGVHFWPLARLFRARSHYVTGIALSALAVSYPWMTSQGPNSPLGPLGAGLILLTGACAALIADSRQRS